eukprot:6176493-Pleurochrysis_carterae.AAC.2
MLVHDGGEPHEGTAPQACIRSSGSTVWQMQRLSKRVKRRLRSREHGALADGRAKVPAVLRADDGGGRASEAVRDVAKRRSAREQQKVGAREQEQVEDGGVEVGLRGALELRRRAEAHDAPGRMRRPLQRRLERVARARVHRRDEQHGGVGGREAARRARDELGQRGA